MSNRIKLIYAAILLSASASAQPHSFAVVTDTRTLKNCGPAIEAYRESVCKDGLDAFIAAKDWESPDELRDSLMHYHKSRALEGAVFIGDIPIAMITGAQHLTSAFKMDEGGRWPMRDCSVPSDRFYDDFDLKFRSLGRDSVETNFFYYALAPDSPQHISCDIYTGRIKSSEKRQVRGNLALPAQGGRCQVAAEQARPPDVVQRERLVLEQPRGVEGRDHNPSRADSRGIRKL